MITDLREYCKGDGLYRSPSYSYLVAELLTRTTNAKFPPDHEYQKQSAELEMKIHAQLAALRRWKYTWLDDQMSNCTTLPEPIPNYPSHLFGPALNF